MKIEVEFTWVVGLLITNLGAFWGLGKMMLSQSQRHIDEKFAAMAETLKQQDQGTRRLERELLELRAELPREYVRREDHNRVIGAIQVSIDNVSLKIDRAMLERGSKP
jgi:hypothetical protein